MKQRINDLLDYLQLSSAQFADIIGVQRSSISHILSGRNKPSFDFINKILLKYPKINANWLISGSGLMFLENKESEQKEKPNTTSDLFSNVSESPVKPKENSTFLLEKKSKLPRENASEEPTNIQEKISEITNVNKVKSVILIYEDDTFKILSGK